jgi:hypothetical protein
MALANFCRSVVMSERAHEQEEDECEALDARNVAACNFLSLTVKNI